MNKILSLVLLTIPFMFGCDRNNESMLTSSNDPAVQTSSDGSTVVALSQSNVSTYFTIDCTNGYVNSVQNHYFQINGVLSFAIYDNVTILLNFKATKDASVNNSEYSLKLNAAGNGTAVVSYSDGKINGTVDTGVSTSLYLYDCSWTIKSISGTVKYRI